MKLLLRTVAAAAAIGLPCAGAHAQQNGALPLNLKGLTSSLTARNAQGLNLLGGSLNGVTKEGNRRSNRGNRGNRGGDIGGDALAPLTGLLDLNTLTSVLGVAAAPLSGLGALGGSDGSTGVISDGGGEDPGLLGLLPPGPLNGADARSGSDASQGSATSDRNRDSGARRGQERNDGGGSSDSQQGGNGDSSEAESFDTSARILELGQLQYDMGGLNLIDQSVMSSRPRGIGTRTAFGGTSSHQQRTDGNTAGASGRGSGSGEVTSGSDATVDALSSSSP